jgi:hypothetical protein
MGIDFSVFIILLIIAIPIFLFWRWVFRKTESRAKRKILSLILTVVTAPVFYGLMILAWVLLSSYYPSRNFDRKAWLTDSDRRYEYTHDLINRKLLIGKTRAQVEQLLGANGDTSQSELYYYIGFRPELTGIDPSSLIIDFNNGKVDTVIEHDK